ncbi:MAG: penicillin-binding protein activator [Holosporaceae bacterium]|jgi:ABC-type branched-subunit amino acid transport system substrate-binding protein|nr:penicillin-binding protein activator [Holosporaceae bacterium]
MYQFIRLLSLVLLASCSPSKDIHYEKSITAHEDDLIDPYLKVTKQRNNSILLLLPISGRNESIGRGILNACFLATDDSHDIDFYVVDTDDTSIEKHALYDQFRNKRLRAIIGPVFSNKTKQYGALFPQIPVLSFSNNLGINGDHVFACGLSLQDEIRALFSYAHKQNIDSFLIILPNGELGNQVLEIINSELKKYGLCEGDDFEIIRYTSMSMEAATKYAKNSNKKAVFVINPILNINQLEDMIVFTISSVALSNKEAWDDAVFAFSDNSEQQDFVQKYQSIFGTQPTILDIIAYDLMKIAKNSINSEKSIAGSDYDGCLGEFSISKKSGLTRKLQVFRLKNSEKIDLE